jgi:DNA-binding NtrC family response regulator
MKLKSKILVVDDEEQLVQLLARQLERLSHTTYMANSAQEALDILQQDTTIDVLVTDFKMPEINGVELIARAIKLDPKIQGIIVTGYLDDEITDQAMQAGAVGCFEKPVDFVQLGNAIESCVQNRH